MDMYGPLIFQSSPHNLNFTFYLTLLIYHNFSIITICLYKCTLFLTGRKIWSVHHTHYYFTFDMTDGHSVMFNNSLNSINSKHLENDAFRCAAISYTATEAFHYVQQFSIYIQVEFIESAMVYIERDTNIESRYMATTRMGSIHYIGRYDTDKQHIISLAAHIVHKNTSTFYIANYYLSITQELSCINNAKGKLNVFFYTTTFPTANYTTSVGIGNYMLFHGPCVYFKTMYDIMKIILVYMPRCDVVVNYVLLSTLWKGKQQEECMPGYYKVRL